MSVSKKGQFQVGDRVVFESGSLKYYGTVIDPSPFTWENDKAKRIRVRYDGGGSVAEPGLKYVRHFTKLERVLK